ncbi:vegetative cell wall protein gp1-like [Panicum virgatum]|uniref:vegetative cell wall protein gp1-like n=1 Tax=Panicum virgatum TaxID=38727 RepID=UPI0019D54678|nr:vegetative cell wall protein gp1-like [Panicum virgatum]
MREGGSAARCGKGDGRGAGRRPAPVQWNQIELGPGTSTISNLEARKGVRPFLRLTASPLPPAAPAASLAPVPTPSPPSPSPSSPTLAAPKVPAIAAPEIPAGSGAGPTPPPSSCSVTSAPATNPTGSGVVAPPRPSPPTLSPTGQATQLPPDPATSHSVAAGSGATRPSTPAPTSPATTGPAFAPDAGPPPPPPEVKMATSGTGAGSLWALLLPTTSSPNTVDYSLVIVEDVSDGEDEATPPAGAVGAATQPAGPDPLDLLTVNAGRPDLAAVGVGPQAAMGATTPDSCSSPPSGSGGASPSSLSHRTQPRSTHVVLVDARRAVDGRMKTARGPTTTAPHPTSMPCVNQHCQWLRPHRAPRLVQSWRKVEVEWALDDKNQGEDGGDAAGLPARPVEGRIPARQRLGRHGQISAPNADGWREILPRLEAQHAVIKVHHRQE